jgi:hypothetical protein
VTADVTAWKRFSKALRLLEATVEIDGQVRPSARHGAALWGATWDEDMVGLCWAWREVRPHVAVLEDPMSISSNVVLLDEAGHPLVGWRRILHLNWTVYNLHWQRSVLRRAEHDQQDAWVHHTRRCTRQQHATMQ